MTEQDTKLREQSARGEEARRILGSPLVKEAFENLRKDALASWEHTRIDEQDTREDAWRMFQALKLLEENFTRIVKTGEHAHKTLAQQLKSTTQQKGT